jgi:hypothetical protein
VLNARSLRLNESVKSCQILNFKGYSALVGDRVDSDATEQGFQANNNALMGPGSSPEEALRAKRD